MRAWILPGLVVLLVTAVPAFAWAQPTPQAVEQARQRYQKGETYYQIGQFEQAIAEYKAAYELSKAPALLFNIAQAYRLQGDYEQSLYFYRTYLRLAPEAQNRADVEAWIVEVTRLQQEKTEREEAGRKAEAERQRQQALREEAERRERERVVQPVKASGGGSRGLRIAGYATAGSGLALAGTGLVFYFKSRSDWNEVNRIADEHEPWTSEAQAAWDSAGANRTRAYVLFGVGGAAAVAGGVMSYLGWGRGHEAPVVAVSPRAGGAQVGISWRY